MKRLALILLLAGTMQPALADSGSATAAEIESAWLAFDSARGEPSLILGDPQHLSANKVFRTIPEFSEDSIDADKLQLGFDLFHEAQLSKDGSVACASCHVTMLGGVDRNPLPFGIGGARGDFNTPTIFNSALNFRQFWDGRALTLQEQSLGPIESPMEMDHDLDSVVATLQGLPEYANAFERLYHDGVTPANLGDAIAYYETMNFTGMDSPFLRQLRGEQQSLNPRAQRGQQRFVEVGCASCHNGVNLGGNSYQQLGTAQSFYGGTRRAREADAGVFTRSGREQDRHVFKVPGLHNVASTGPWFHDGSVTSLQQAIDLMARHQSGRYLDNRDIDDIAAFLRTLGDTQTVIGDCTAVGNYAVSMDCDARLVEASPAQTTSTSLSPLPDAEELAQQHEQQYRAAQNNVAQAPARIQNEMERIRRGEVAHYDFLQYEHIEMLRHARALSYPPANIEAAEREALLEQAAELQKEAELYELTIADFLRSHAVASNAKSNFQDLLHILSSEADEATLPRLAWAEQSLLAYHAEPGPQRLTELHSATEALKDIGLDSQRLAELELQLQMLLNDFGSE